MTTTDAEDDVESISTAQSLTAILVGLAPTAYVVYGLLTDEDVPRWVLLSAPFSLVYAFVGYVSLRVRCDEAFRRRALETAAADGSH